MSHKSALADASKPSTAVLFSDRAIDQFTQALLQFPDPDLVLKQAGLSRADLRRLESDDEISAALETRMAACISTPWRLEGDDQDIVDFVTEHLDAFGERIMTASWTAAPYGYSVQEIIYRKADDGHIVWDRVEERPFEWFRPMPDGGLKFYRCGISSGSVLGAGEVVDTTFKFFLTRRRPTYRNPYGEAVLSRLYWPWFFRTNGWKFWAVFLERFGSPLLVGKTKGKTEDMSRALAAAVQSAVLAIGAEDSVDAISPAQAGDAFTKFSEQVDRRIQKVILGQTLTTDVTGGGSYAAANVHDRVRDDRKRMDLRMVAGTVQRMIDALVALNFRGAPAPKFLFDDGKGLQKDRAERDATLTRAGVVLTEQYILRAYDFEPGDFTVGPVPPQPVGASPARASAGDSRSSLMFATSGNGGPQFTPNQQALEELADQALADARSPVPAYRIAAAIRESSGPEDLEARLARLFSQVDTTAFADLLERALFAADVMGYAHMDESA